MAYRGFQNFLKKLETF